MHRFFALFFFVFLLSCTSEPSDQSAPTAPSAEEAAPDIPPPSTPTAPATGPTKLIINLENFRLRATPGVKGQEISRLAKGTVVTDLGEVSDFTTPLKLRGVDFDEPWVKVRTADGIEGWVYGGGVHFSMDNPTELAQKLMERRLRTLFKGLTPAILQYQKDYQNAQTSDEYAAIYRRGAKLRDTLVHLLSSKVIVGDYNSLPDLFWLEEAMPGYVPQLVAEGTEYYLFQDYKKMYSQARKTRGVEDNDYITLCTHVHAMDSVEYFFPSWFLQTWDYGGSSLLGQGVHLRLLEEINQVLQRSTYFEAEILELKNDLIRDITWTENSYWEPIESIRKELDDILAAAFTILSPEDITELQARRKMFDDPAANNIQVNQKSGQ